VAFPCFFHIVPMKESFARAIADWHSEGVYAFCDFDRDPEDRAELFSPGCWAGRYFTAPGDSGGPIGFFCFEPDGGAVEPGLGWAPCETGKGSGAAFAEAGLAFARRRFQPKRFSLKVAAFNRRAIRVYEKLGFRIEKTFLQRTNGGEFKFLSMAREESKNP
jgi:ribosomal-protein-alanine N-acetyltransferase